MRWTHCTLALGLGGTLLVPARAQAFCGTYVGSAGELPTNRESRAVVARAGQATTLTMFNDVAAGSTTFGVVIPVPEDVGAGNVRVIDSDLLGHIEEYSAPRLVDLTCDDLYFDQANRSSGVNLNFGCTFGSNDDDLWFDTAGGGDTGMIDTGTGVVVEDTFTVGEYQAWVVSGDDGDGLEAWLSTQGFFLPPDIDNVLDDYIAKGSWFLALRVDLEEPADQRVWLSPVQIGYLSETMTLPLRMGTLSSEGVQDLVVTFVTDHEGGEVSISNLGDPAEIPDECMLDDDRSFAEQYEELVEHAVGLPADPGRLDGLDGASWAVEYSWGSGKCDPCPPGGALTAEQAERFGLPGASSGFHITRMRLRYTPMGLRQDPAFYLTGRADMQAQQRYVRHSWELEGEFPPCFGESPRTAGTCFSAAWWAQREQEVDAWPVTYGEVDDGCGDKNRGLLVLGLPLLLGLRRRRQP